MVYRKKIESWLEQDAKHWSELKLLESNGSSYRWQLTVGITDYEINYSDLGYITLSSIPSNNYIYSEVREIYHGDNSEQSYRSMIQLLSDNFLNYWL